jgi:hypothetical protein
MEASNATTCVDRVDRTRDDVRDLAFEHRALEVLELEEENARLGALVADLRADAQISSEIIRAALDQLHALTTRYKQLQADSSVLRRDLPVAMIDHRQAVIEDLTDTIVELRGRIAELEARLLGDAA